MEAWVINAVALGIVLALAVLAGPLRLWLAHWLPLLLGAVALGTLLALEGLAFGAWAQPFPAEPLLTLLAWFAMGSAARAAGGPRLPKHPAYAAFTAGILMGDLAAAAWLLPLVRDPKLGARLALIASVGGLFSPVGTPARLLLVNLPSLGLLPVLLALIVFPLREPAPQPLPQGRWGVSAVLLAVMGVAFTPHLRLPALLAGAVLLNLMAGRRRRVWLPWRELSWLVGMAVVLGAARSAGALAEVRTGLDLLQGLHPSLTPALLVLGGALLALLAGEAAGALLIWTLFDSGAGQAALLLLPLVGLGLAVGEGGLWRGRAGLLVHWPLRALQLGLVLTWVLLGL